MRVLFCLNGPDQINGPNVWLTRHLPLLRARGLSPELLYLSWNPELCCRFRTKLADAGFPFRVVKLGRFIEDNVEAIIAALADDLPDAFVPNYCVPAYFAARFLRVSGVATIGILHSDDPYYHDILDIFVRGPETWRLTALVGVSRYLGDLVANQAGEKCRYLNAPYGAPLPKHVARYSDKVFRLMYCGRLVEHQKRVRRVAEAFLAAATAITNCEGVLWGSGPEYEPLQSYLLENCPSGQVRLGGELDSDEVQDAMLSCQAIVLLSDFEGLSIALMEAMAAGLVPIIARMRSGSDDLVVHGVNGFIVNPNDQQEFVDAVRSMACNSDLWERLSTAARRTIIERGYTSDACAQKWSLFLRDVADASPSTPVRMLPRHEWALPRRSTRPHGIRSEDNRGLQGLLGSALDEARPVYLWGASLAGQAFLESIPNCVSRITGFVDSNPAKHATRFHGLQVVAPEHVFALHAAGIRPFIVITSQFASEIGASLSDAGLLEDADFVAY